MSKVVLSSIIDIVSGGTPKTSVPKYWNGDIGWLSVTDFNNDNRFVYNTEKTITEKGVKESNTKFLNVGEIIISARGTVGALAQIGKPMCFNQSCFGLRGKKNLVENDYLFYALKNYVKNIVKRSQGSVFDTINLASFDLMELDIHSDISTQKSIAKVLSDLDAKIELNNRINRELEAMAKTLYDYWFVQFDFPCLPSDYRPSGQVNPNSDLAEKIKAFSTYTKVGGLPLPDGIKWFVYVILCEDGSFYKGMTNDLYRRFYEHYTGQGADWTKTHKPKKIIHWEQFNTQDEARRREEELKTGFSRTWLQRENEKIKKYGYKAIDGLPAHQTRLMPAGKMVYNAELKRGIPEGWEVKTFFKCCRVQYGFPFSTDYFNTVGNGIPVIRIRDILENSISNYSSEQNIDTKYLINKGDILVGMDGNFHINYWAKDNCYLNQRAVKLSETILPNIYLKYQIEPFIKLREKSVSRTTVGHLSDKDLKSLSIIIPSKEVLSSITSIYNGVLQRMIQTKNENQHLSELRDWLLPMLMNGQVVSTGSTTRAEVPEPVEGIAAEPNVEYKKG